MSWFVSKDILLSSENMWKQTYVCRVHVVVFGVWMCLCTCIPVLILSSTEVAGCLSYIKVKCAAPSSVATRANLSMSSPLSCSTQREMGQAIGQRLLCPFSLKVALCDTQSGWSRSCCYLLLLPHISHQLPETARLAAGITGELPGEFLSVSALIHCAH